MTVSIDLRDLLPRREEGRLNVIGFTAAAGPPGAGDEDQAVALGRAVNEANKAATSRWFNHDGGVAISGMGSYPGPDCPVFSVLYADTDKALGSWLGVIAEQLELAGWSGRLVTEPGRQPEVSRHSVTSLTAVLCFEGWRRTDRLPATSVWRYDEALAAELAAWTVDWLTPAGEPMLYLSQGPGMYLLPRDRVLADLAAHPDDSKVVCSEDPDHARHVMYDVSGRLLVQLRDLDLTWQQRLDAVREVVLHHAARCEQAYVRHSWSGLLRAGDVVSAHRPRLPDAVHFDYRRERRLDHSHVPDPCGLQVLTDAHLARAADLRRWTVTSLGGGRNLVEADDLEAWFAGDEPDPDVFAQAREDFGEMLLPRTPRRPKAPPTAAG